MSDFVMSHDLSEECRDFVKISAQRRFSSMRPASESKMSSVEI